MIENVRKTWATGRETGNRYGDTYDYIPHNIIINDPEFFLCFHLCLKTQIRSLPLLIWVMKI